MKIIFYNERKVIKMKFYELKEVMNDKERLMLNIMHSTKDGRLCGLTRESCRTYEVPDDVLDCDVGPMYITAVGSLHITLYKREEL